MIRIQNIKLDLDYTDLDLKKAVGMKLHIPFEKILEVKLRKRSVDARKKEQIIFLATLDVRVKADSEKKILQKCRNDKDVSQIQDKKYKIRICKNNKANRPVVVGFGPAGMFCAYVLAKAGLRPIVLERGCPVEERTEHVQNFK
ncbi:MAG: FAD-dependent oxidoreductase, partial [Oscillospiraceae bacterium]|nr:FAD-dependent oxidoreductase [Oscillospiraceae bacterium]